MSEQKNSTKDIKLYSSKSITSATFLGGPLAAGYLISENFKALNKEDLGRKSLIIGITATILLFAGMFMLPENIIDKIPSQLIPLIYTGIIWGIVEWNQGEILKAHKENGNSFFSGWKVALISFISFLIIGIPIFTIIYLESKNPSYITYDSKIAEFSQNEAESLTFYNNIYDKDKFQLLSELNSKVIPKWEKNIDIIKGLDTIHDLPTEFLNQNKVLLKYSELRLEAFLLIKKAILEDTDKYEEQINMLNKKIDLELKKLE